MLPNTILRHIFAGACLCLIAIAPSLAQTKTRLLVYTTLVPEYINSYKRAFEADHPDIEIALHQDSTGIVTARLLAEKAAPRADAVWGLAVTSAMVLDREGMLYPYAPKGLADIKPNFRDPNTPPAWVGMEAWAAAICFNTAEAAKLKLPAPKSWYDLLEPVYRGRIVMPNPASSGTGFFHVSAWLQLWGEAAGWQFMDRLHENIAVYVHSGTKPCRDAAQGEFPVGIAYDLVGAAQKSAGAPIDVLVMREGGGWDVDTVAILKGTKNLEAAQIFLDWATGRKANELYAGYATLVAHRELKPFMPGYPAGVEESLIRNDFAWAAANRDRILAEWQRRYEGKSAPR
jgi:iron(III) transport system substrate-binding protein